MRLQITIAILLQFPFALLCCNAETNAHNLQLSEESVLGKWYMQSTEEALGIAVITDLEIDFRADHWAVIRDRGRVGDAVSNETFRSPWAMQDVTIVLDDLFAEKYLVEGTYHRDSGTTDWKLGIRKTDDGRMTLVLPGVDTPFVRTQSRRFSRAGLLYDIGPSLILGVILLRKPQWLLKKISNEKKRDKYAKLFPILGIAMLIISGMRIVGALGGLLPGD